jgi:hypothetical protein
MAYDHNMINNYDHLAGSEKRAHEGSQSMGHMAGGSAGYTTSLGGKSNSYGANEHDPGGYTPGKVGSGGKHDLGM